MAKQATKKYRLMRGTHDVPNPEFDPDSDDPVRSHVRLEPGALVELNDDQYKAFHDRFEPAESAASDVKTADQAQLQAAKAEAVRTGTTVNPNPRSQ